VNLLALSSLRHNHWVISRCIWFMTGCSIGMCLSSAENDEDISPVPLLLHKEQWNSRGEGYHLIPSRSAMPSGRITGVGSWTIPRDDACQPPHRHTSGSPILNSKYHDHIRRETEVELY
jgi:cell division protein FtsW (lipid II flippase)